MAIRGAQRHLAHAPWFIARFFDDFCMLGNGALVECIDIIHHQIREVLMITKTRHGDGIGTSAAHEVDLVAMEVQPVAFINDFGLAAEDALVPVARALEIGDCQNIVVALYVHGADGTACRRDVTCGKAGRLQESARGMFGDAVRCVESGLPG